VGRRVAALDQDQQGQITLLAVLGAAAFACLLLLVVNSGYGITGKIEMQNASDASAVSAATWVARGLNVISMNNVAQTELLALAMIIPAMERTAQIVEGILKVQIIASEALIGVPYVGVAAEAYLVGVLYPQQKFLTSTILPAAQALQPLARAPSGVLWSMMKALEMLSGAVAGKAGFALIAQSRAVLVAQENGADFGWMLGSGRDGVSALPAIPVRRGDYTDLCSPTREGSPTKTERGYHPLIGWNVKEGPLAKYGDVVGKWAFGWFSLNTGSTVIFEKIREANLSWYCDGKGGSFSYAKTVDSLEKCRAERGGTAVWIPITLRTVEMDHPDPTVITVAEDDPRIDRVEGDFHHVSHKRCDEWTPPGTQVRPGVWRKVHEYPRTEQYTDDQGRLATRTWYTYEIEEWSFKRAEIPTTEDVNNPVAGLSEPNRPVPYLLGEHRDEKNDEIRQSLEYFVFVYRSRGVGLGERVFRSPLGTHRVTYAQARVFNGTSFDTFTQDWRVKLVPADMLERLLDDGEAAGGSLEGPEIEVMREMGIGVVGSDVVAFINNH